MIYKISNVFTDEEINKILSGHLDLVNDKIDFILQIIEKLEGSYNNSGIRNWFFRPRQLLNNVSPFEIFINKWNPKDDKSKNILELLNIGDAT